MRHRVNTTTGVKVASKLRPMQSTRALSKAESTHVRKRLEKLLTEYKTQTALALKLDISQQVLSRILNGNSVGLYVARRVADLTKMSVDDVLSAPVFVVDDAIAAHPRRWSSVTIATVRAMPKVETLSADEAMSVLDMTEAALAPVRRELQRITR